MEWPNLSGIGHVSGRLATEEDINAGSAVFLLQSEGERIGSPMEIEIPQFAIHHDSDSGEKTRVIVIQAEETQDQQAIGVLDFESSGYAVGLFHEYEFLGTTPPEI